jgi:hypothetical protein
MGALTEPNLDLPAAGILFDVGRGAVHSERDTPNSPRISSRRPYRFPVFPFPCHRTWFPIARWCQSACRGHGIGTVTLLPMSLIPGSGFLRSRTGYRMHRTYPFCGVGDNSQSLRSGTGRQLTATSPNCPKGLVSLGVVRMAPKSGAYPTETGS